MQTYISYVIQEETGHKHHADIVSYPGPPFILTPEWQYEAVKKWMDKKLSEITDGQELIITGIFNLSKNQQLNHGSDANNC